MKKLNEILGTQYPIIQGGMANIATGEFAAACSNAGALGMIATGGWDAGRLRQEIRRARELTIGLSEKKVNFFYPAGLDYRPKT